MLLESFGSFLSADASKEWTALHFVSHLALAFHINKFLRRQLDWTAVDLLGNNFDLGLDFGIRVALIAF